MCPLGETWTHDNGGGVECIDSKSGWDRLRNLDVDFIPEIPERRKVSLADWMRIWEQDELEKIPQE
jgi:hypothetical protein